MQHLKVYNKQDILGVTKIRKFETKLGEKVQVAADPGHPRASELVGELAVGSDEFAALWARHDVEGTTRGQMRVRHPLAGELNLDWDAYPIPGNPGPALMVCTAAEGSPDAERLQQLADLLGTP